MKILLTGGMGYIGSHTAVELIEAGHEVAIVDNLSNSKDTVLQSIEDITGARPRFFKADLLDEDTITEILLEGHYDLVIHFAGLKAVAESVDNPLLYYDNNIRGTINLLRAMWGFGPHKIIFSSSATVYGEQKEKKYTEDMTTGVGITNPYGWSKFMIEQILRDEAVSDKRLEVGILRYFNPVGAHPSGLLGEDPNGIPNNLMPIIMKVSTGDIKELKIYGNDYDTPDGTCRRDFIHVVDLAKGHMAMIDALKPGVSTYNLGTGKPVSVMEMVKAFEKERGEELPYSFAERRAGDLAEFYADPSKAEKELGWKAELSIEDAMRDTIRFIDTLEG